MADPVVDASSNVWLGGYDLTRALNGIRLVGSRAELPDGRYGDELDVTYPGIQLVDAMLDGFYAAGAGEPDTVASPRVIGAAADFAEWPLTICPPSAPGAAGADGNVAYTLRTAQLGMRFGAEHGKSLPFYVTSRARTGRLSRDTVMIPKATRTATLTGTARQLGALTANVDKLQCVLHVFSVTGGGGSVTVTVESDNAEGFPSAVVRGSFTAVATAPGVGRQVLEIAAPITDDWWRFVATWTAGTNYVLAATAAKVAV